MNIHRYAQQPFNSAHERIKFCLDQLEKAEGFSKRIDWNTEIVKHCTVEELIGALVSAEQHLKLSERFGV